MGGMLTILVIILVCIIMLVVFSIITAYIDSIDIKKQELECERNFDYKLRLDDLISNLRKTLGNEYKIDFVDMCPTVENQIHCRISISHDKVVKSKNVTYKREYCIFKKDLTLKGKVTLEERIYNDLGIAIGEDGI